MVKNFITKAVKKVTLEVIYEVVEERSKEIYEKLEKIERRQEEDFRYLNQKIDTQIGQLRQEIGQLRQEMNQLNQKIDDNISQLRQEIRQEVSQLNQRIDTVIQLLVDLSRKG